MPGATRGQCPADRKPGIGLSRILELQFILQRQSVAEVLKSGFICQKSVRREGITKLTITKLWKARQCSWDIAQYPKYL